MHICLCKILVFVAYIDRCIYELDLFRNMKYMEDSTYQVFECARLSCAGVIEAAGRLAFHQPCAYLHHIFYVDKIAYLFTIFIFRNVRTEEFYLATFFDL